MEIYTGDFYGIIEKRADDLVEQCKIRADYYTVADEMHDCVTEIRNKISERLTIEFRNMVKKHETGVYYIDFETDLFKIINEL